MVPPRRTLEERPPVVQLRALKTRQKILQQAELAFAEHGFHNAAVTADILVPAGVSVGSFYHQFSNKLELLLAVLGERTPRLQVINDLMTAPERTSFDDVVRVTLNALIDDLEASPAAYLIAYRERMNSDPSVREMVVAGPRRWALVMGEVITHWFSGSPNAEAAGRRVVNTLRAWILDYLLATTDEREQLRAIDLEVVVDFCVGGVDRAAGTAVIERS